MCLSIGCSSVMMKPKPFTADPDSARREVRAELYYMDCSEGIAGTHGADQPQRRRNCEPYHAPVPAKHRVCGV